LAEKCAADDQLAVYSAIFIEYSRTNGDLLPSVEQKEFLVPWQYRMFTRQETFDRFSP